MAAGDGAHGKHDPHFPIGEIFKTPEERALLNSDITDRLRSAGDREEGRPYSTMHEAADEIDRLRAIIVADTHVLLSRRPVAWRVKDYADGWVIYQDEALAYNHSDGGALMQGLYVRDGK